jgi:sn-glycerol 3-phosphate transport system substrate-binding protein
MVGRKGGWTTAAVLAVLAVLAGACGGDDGGGGGAGNGATGDNGDADLRPCRLDAVEEAAAADGPVEITMWHGQARVNEEVLIELTDAFNASQDAVQVQLVAQPGSGDLMNNMVAGITTGELPDVAMITDVEQQLAMDTGLILPAQSCVDAAGFDLSDFLPQAVEYYTVDGVLQAVPFHVASPLLLYNKTVFADAGLDPEDPPETLDELHQMAQTIADAGYEAGFALHRYGWYFEQFMALAGEMYFDNGNGRQGRADEVVFDNESGRAIFSTISEMLEDGSAVSFPGRGSIDHLTSLGEGLVGMTMQSSSALGGVYQALFLEGQYADAEFGVAPLPAPGPAEDGGVVVGGGALYIVSGTEPDPATEAAAWRYIEFLSSAESAATWAAGTGYVPVRESAVDQPVLQERWAEAPFFRVPYDQLVEGAANEATAGGLHAQMEEVRMVIEDAWRRMDDEGLPPDEALEGVVAEANQVLQDYNARI